MYSSIKWCWMPLLILAVAMILTVLPAKAQTYLELEKFDRKRPDCWGYAEPEPLGTPVRCAYDVRAVMHLEIPIIEELQWLRLIAQSEVTANTRNRGEAGHVDPVKGEFGAGILLRWRAWSLTLFAASRHCFDYDCPDPGDAYNAMILRWTDQP